MSGGEEFNRLKVKNFEELNDSSCSSCGKKYKSNGGIKYCARCQEYLFVPCMEDVDEFSTRVETQGATQNLDPCIDFGTPVQGKTQGAAGSGCSVWSCSVNLPMLSTTESNMEYEHRTNVGNGYLEEYPVCKNTYTQADRISRANHEIDNLIEEMKKTERRKQNQRTELKAMKTTCLKNIQTFRTEINKAIDRLEEATIAELENIFQDIDNVLYEKLSGIQKSLSILIKTYDDLNQQLSQSFERDSSVTDVFETAESLLCGEPDVQPQLIFVQNTKLLDILGSFHSLGFCEYQERQELYRIHSMEIIDIRQDSDREDCSIRSSCILNSGDILMADYKNKNIKFIDGKDYRVKDVLPLNHYPLSVCAVGETQAVVALAETKYFGGDNRIQFLTTKDKLVPTRSVRLDHCCTGIAVVSNQIFVSNERKRLYVYDLTGELINTIYLDQSGIELFSKSFAITESDNGKMIHVTDLNKGLVTLSKEGHLLWKYSGPELKMAWGVCTDGKGSIFVTGSNSSNVVQIGPGGKYLGEVVSESNGIKDLQAICYDKKKSKLILSKYNCNSIHIISVL